MADDLKKVKELLEIINNKVGKLETHVNVHTSTMHVIKDQQSVMNEKLDEINENVDAARGDIEKLHDDVKGIRDTEGLFHSRNKREIDEIKTHIGLPLMSDTPQV